MTVSRLRRLLHIRDVFHDFVLFHFWFRSPAFFEKIFFSVRLSSSLRRVRVSCAVTEDGHYLRSRGVDCPLDPFLTLSSTLALSSAPPRLVPAFKRPPMRPPPFHIVPRSARNLNLAISQEN